MSDKTRNYTVYFEIYGKKMKAIVMAKSEDEAKQKIKEKIIFHKVFIDNRDAFNQSLDMMQDMMDMLK